MLENKVRTELSSLGEFGLIDHLTKDLKYIQPATVKGVGDDAAVILKNIDLMQVVTTDMLVEGIHFDLMYAPLKHLGYKAVTVNLSDVCAMNAVPKQILVSIAVSSKFSLEALEELYSGIITACNTYKVDLVGGDTCSSKSGLIISVTAIGEAKTGDITYRKGAKDKDLLCVTGDLGGAYMGLQILEREKSVFLENPQIQPDVEGNDYLLERQLKPEARIDIVRMFKEMNLHPTAMIDISDGLASEVLHICKQSEVGCNVYEEKIPVDPLTYNRAREFSLDPTVCALSGGEDYELLFTIAQADYEKVKGNPNISIIGYITDKNSGCNLISASNTVTPITAQGWNAFPTDKK